MVPRGVEIESKFPDFLSLRRRVPPRSVGDGGERLLTFRVLSRPQCMTCPTRCSWGLISNPMCCISTEGLPENALSYGFCPPPPPGIKDIKQKNRKIKWNVVFDCEWAITHARAFLWQFFKWLGFSSWLGIFSMAGDFLHGWGFFTVIIQYKVTAAAPRKTRTTTMERGGLWVADSSLALLVHLLHSAVIQFFSRHSCVIIAARGDEIAWEREGICGKLWEFRWI